MVKYITIGFVIYTLIMCGVEQKSEKVQKNISTFEFVDDMSVEHYIYDIVKEGVDGIEIDINSSDPMEIGLKPQTRSRVPIVYVTEGGNCLFFENDTDSLKIISQAENETIDMLKMFIEAAKK
jgi:hypothetical protein